MNKKLVLFALIGTLLLGSKSLAAELPASTFYVPIEYDFVDVKPGDWYFSAAKYAKAQGIFNGNDKGEFNPKSNITRAEMAQILYNIKTTEKTNANSYGVSDKWYKPAMEYALSENITSSKIKATDFGAGAQLSRSEVFDMMYSFGLSEGFAKDISIDTNALEVFADKAKVQSENKTAITWLVANKILNGQLNGGKLYINPSASITRAEVATIMQNLNDYTSKVKSNIDGKSFVIVVKANPTTGYV
ncbi:MAG: S-layer homology domain-containing protein [Clostridia bacterium]|nr:S-layer homology domain-containing protein [Clostridia bacterium]